MSRRHLASMLAGLALAGSLPLTASAKTLPHPPLSSPVAPPAASVAGATLAETAVPKLKPTLTANPTTVNVGVGSTSVAKFAYTISITNPIDQPGPAFDVEVTVPESLFPDRRELFRPNPIFAQSFTSVAATNGFSCGLREPEIGLLGGLSVGEAHCASGIIAPGETATVSVTGQIDGSQLDTRELGPHTQEVTVAWQKHGLGVLGSTTTSSQVTMADFKRTLHLR